MVARGTISGRVNRKVNLFCKKFHKLSLTKFLAKTGRGQPAKKSQPQVMADALLLDTEAAVMSSFAFLEPADVEMDDEDYMGDDMDMVSGNDAEMKQLKLKTKGVIVNDGEFPGSFLEF
jgi:hypothetical protein